MPKKFKHNRQRTGTPEKKPRTKVTYVPEPLPPTGLVRLPTVLAAVQVGRTSWWNGVRDGRFPQPIKLGPRTTVWRAEDIRDFIASIA